RTFLLNWLLARQNGWRVVFRMEDLDTPRTKTGAADQAIDELRWLGLTWDGPVVQQSDRFQAYRSALEALIEAGCAYPCVCSRSDVAAAASAPHAEDNGPAYPGTCRGKFASATDAQQQTGRPVAWRARHPAAPVTFTDAIAGPQSFDMRQTCGDFVVFRNEGIASYQLAVVVDDAQAGVNQIVRGDDLLESTSRQIHLQRILGLSGEVAYYHLPLVTGPDGRRLAKRHGDTRLAAYIQRGTSVNRMLGLLGFWSGTISRREEIDLDELLQRFDPNRIPDKPIVFTKEDDAFLKGK
ncbi:MAG: tRNA glutamyl-Q(34) synthetase GluQRS, partial [Phycisphaerae bacterium]|nr:tRNA glutamyl-Q(34) synthetase GluQRS [Phycisphaerae bacterium]